MNLSDDDDIYYNSDSDLYWDEYWDYSIDLSDDDDHDSHQGDWERTYDQQEIDYFDEETHK